MWAGLQRALDFYVVALHAFDLVTAVSEPVGPRVALLDGVPVPPAHFGLLSDFCLLRAANLAALGSLAQRTALDAVVAGWEAGLAELTTRIGARLIVVAAAMPEPLVDAVSRGLDACWVPDISGAIDELKALRATRAPDAIRHSLADIRVRWRDAGEPALLRDLSNHGLAFEVSDVDVERLLPGCELEQLTLSHRGATALAGGRALVRHVAPLATPGRYLVGAALKPRAPAPGAAAPTLIRNRALAASLVKAGLQTGVVVAPLDGDSRDGAPEVELVGGRLDAERGVMTAASDGALAEHDLVRGQFELAGRLYRFTTVVLATAPLTLKLPGVLEETMQRAAARYRPRPPETLIVEVSSPLVVGVALKAVVDLSANGFSFALENARDLYPIGLQLEVSLRLPDGPLSCAAEVRTLVREGTRLRCGVELIELDAPSRLRLANFVMRLRFPGVDDGAGLGCDELFGFMRETGFLTPDEGGALRSVDRRGARGFTSLYAAPSRIFKAVVAREAGELAGHVSGVRAYRQRGWRSIDRAPVGARGAPAQPRCRRVLLSESRFRVLQDLLSRRQQVAGARLRRLRAHAARPAALGAASVPPSTPSARMRPSCCPSRRSGSTCSRRPPMISPPSSATSSSASAASSCARTISRVRRCSCPQAEPRLRRARALPPAPRAASDAPQRRRRLRAGRALVAGLNLSEALSAFQIYRDRRRPRARPTACGARYVRAVVPIYRHATRPIARGLIAAGRDRRNSSAPAWR